MKWVALPDCLVAGEKRERQRLARDEEALYPGVFLCERACFVGRYGFRAQHMGVIRLFGYRCVPCSVSPGVLR